MQTNVEIKRCDWCIGDPLYMDYHDNEWGKEVKDDKILFEFLILECAQAGLSWITILRRRENYRKAFAKFDAKKVAGFTEKDVDKLMQNEGIIRNRQKIESAITNAELFMRIQKVYGSFYDYLISFFPDRKPIINRPKTISDIPASTPLSETISKDMKKRGFKFFGPTVCYAFLQAVGLIDDHIDDCHCRENNPKE